MTDNYSLWRAANPDASHYAAYQAGYEAARPKAGKAQPITAWAVVDKDDAIDLGMMPHVQNFPDEWRKMFDKAWPARAPHRIARVRIEEIEEGDK